MRVPIKFCFAVTVLALPALATASVGTLYFSEDANANGLYALDTVTGAATNLGISGVGGTTNGLAPSPSVDVLYGSQPFGMLHIQANGSGAAGPFGSQGVEALAYDPGTNTVYGGINGDIFTINPNTGTIIQTLPEPGPDIEGLAWDGKVLFGLGGGGNGVLYYFTPGPNTWTMVGSTGIAFDNHGLAYDMSANVLYAKGQNDPMLYKIDPLTAQTSVIGSTGIQRGGGLAWVPEPASLSLLALGLLLRRR